MTLDMGDIVAIAAFALSAYALWTTSRFNKRQLAMIETQEALNKRLLAQGESEAVAARKADVGASLVKLGNNRYRIRVFNKGKGTARNVTIEFPAGSDLVPLSEIAERFPMEILEQHQSVDLVAAVFSETPAKQAVNLRWDDDHAPNNEKVSYLTL